MRMRERIAVGCVVLTLCCPQAFSGEEQGWKKSIPSPVCESEPGLVKLYWTAWEQAHSRIKTKEGIPQSPYVDEGFSDRANWIWDTCFMVHFCRYAPSIFPGIESLDNFYAPIHDGFKSPLRICILDNPPLFAWTELEYYKLTGDDKRLKKVAEDKQWLQKHYHWFDSLSKGITLPNVSSVVTCLRKHEDGYFWEGGRSGMDNTPRGRTGAKARKARPNNPKMLWIDAIAQQGLSALYISRIAKQMGKNEESKKWQAIYQTIKAKVNSLYWDEKDGVYYDIHADTKEHMKVMTPASFWPMLAEMCTPEQAARMVEHVKNPNKLGGKVPWVTVSRDDADFVPTNGNYWRGSVWLPTAYMGIKALEKYGYHQLASQNAYSIVKHMEATYQNVEPHTIWECYSPNEPKPAKHGRSRVRKDFCGWSALGPISLFIENILGFEDINAASKEVKWRLTRKDRHGIKGLVFGDVKADIIHENGKVMVKTNQPFCLIINGTRYDVKREGTTLRLVR